MLLELPAGGGEGGPCLVADEQAAAELLLQRVDPCADRGLGHMQPLGGADEVSRGHDRQKGAGQLRVQFHLGSN